MAEDKKAILQGKMNQDIDDRILPNGEYRSAQNIQVTTSEESDIGSIQNLLGNTKIQTPVEVNNIISGFKNLDTIGAFFDEKNNRIFYFVTNYSCADHQKKGLLGDTDGPTTALQADNNAGNLFCGIFMYKHNNLNISLPGTISLLVQGLFLNFSKTHTITGVNLIEELLFFTDGFNQPRKINVEKAINQKATDTVPYYTTEEKISVAKFAPFIAPLLLDYETTTLNNNPQATTTDSLGQVVNVSPTSSMQTNASFPDDVIDEKFVRFSYRYRFVDGEYSTIAPFTQVCFIPKTPNLDASHMQKLLKRGQVYFQDENGNADGMVNSVNSVNLNIILPSRTLTTTLDIDGIEILYKESNNNLIRAIELIEIKNENAKDLVTPSNSSSFQQNEGVFQYKYKSNLPYKTLPADQLPRVYDNVPLSAKAQEIIGNRVVYGNFVQDRLLPVENGITGLNFNSAFDFKFDTTNPFGNADFNNYYVHKEYPFHSIKQRRAYEIGVVLSDKFGRQSPVLTSTVKDSSVSVPAKDENFYSASWDNNGFINAISPGNENFCGDALTISFNRPIPNAYAAATLIPINISTTSSFNYAFNVYKNLFVTDPLLQGGGGTGVVLGNLYYYSSIGFLTEGVTDFLYLDPSFQTVLTGQTEVYARQGLDSGTANTVSIHKIELNSDTGAVQNISIVNISVFQNALIGPSAPILIASAGEAAIVTNDSTAVTPDQNALANSPFPELGNIYNLTITNFSEINSFQVGDYLKGQNDDFVKIVAIQQQGSIPPFDQGLNIFTDGPASLSYKNYVIDANGNFDFGAREFYTFFKYKITTHGWYSYRIVVKQTEQDYNNVYAPGIYDFEDASYVPILADNINKVTRDTELSNTQEVGLSTSKDKLFPKVVPNASNTALSVLSDNDVLDVINIGTSKEQGVKNGSEHVLGFISEPNKNPLLAQIPFGSSVNNNIGSDTAAGLLGTTFNLSMSSSGGDNTSLKKAGKVLSIKGGDVSQFLIGEYLKGANEDLVKIIKVTPGTTVLVECDGEISTEYSAAFNGETIAKYQFRYGVQENLAVLETKPVESALDIYYETSTSGLVHELNEAVLTAVDFDKIRISSTFAEDILYYDNDVFQNEYAAIIRFFDALDNEISSQDINQVTINSIRGFVETDFNDGVSTIEDTSLDFQETLYSEGDSYAPFEIILIDGDWKIKPTQNFVHAVDNEHPNAYEFTISFNHQQTATQEVNITNQVFTLSLENIAPAVEANINLTVSVETSEGNGASLVFGSNNNDRVLVKIEATNGCADPNLNQEGLLYFLKDFNPSDSSLITLENGEEVAARTVIRDTNGNVVQEVELDNETGEIKMRDDFEELFHGVLNKTFEIDVYDSDVLDFDSTEYTFDNQGAFFGRKSTTTINLQITADLIIIDLTQADENGEPYGHKYYNNTGGEKLNFIKIWEQVPQGDDDTKNMHWSEGTGDDAFTDPGLSSANSDHLFICSYYDWADDNPHRGEAWGIKIDEETGEPVVNRFERVRDGIQSSTSNFFFFSTSNPFENFSNSNNTEGNTQFAFRSNTGIMRKKESGGSQSTSHVRYTDLRQRGIAGNFFFPLPNGSIEPPGFYSGEGLFTDPSSELNMEDRFAQNITQFQFGRIGHTSATNFSDLEGRPTVGAYVYYNINGGFSGAIGHPDQRLPGPDQGYKQNGEMRDPEKTRVTYMFDLPNNVNVLNSYEYKVFYEVQRKRKINAGIGNDHWMCKRVFLARRGDNSSIVDQ